MNGVGVRLRAAAARTCLGAFHCRSFHHREQVVDQRTRIHSLPVNPYQSILTNRCPIHRLRS